MAHALQLAAKGRGATSPNPMVGAVVVRNGRIVGDGFHRRAGEPHAEIIALTDAGKKANGATLYVNLEPCCHHGKTGPCTEAIIAAGIRHVVYSLKDPDKRVAGKGAAILRKAGVTVTSGVFADEAEQLNEYYLFSQRHRRPMVILKLAQSLDGCIAAKSGDSKWISGSESRKLVHQMRSEVDAVVVGAETVRRDNPRLNVRDVDGPNPRRLVVFGNRRIPATVRLFAQNKDKKTTGILTVARSADPTEKRLKKIGVDVWRAGGREGRVNPRFLVRAAHEHGIRSMMIEGGRALATAFVNQELVDKIVLFTAPMIIGNGIHALGELGIQNARNALRFGRTSWHTIGDDLLFVGYPEWSR
jgi:diaminohydroxyphosphoribosylaminopyrimidine deaminase/5-amino-6-(5-phosphoribosylamino)uracil reductase